MPGRRKTKPPFYPDSPSSVGSPRKDGFRKRTVRQRTPRKLCSLVLPPPLMSLFDDSGGGNDSIPTSASMVENAFHHRSNASVVSASIASVGGMSTVDHLPQHLRVGMAQCDPLIVFHGRFVLVATCDGRIAIYSISDFDTRSGISEDVEASERRKRAEWMEEDSKVQQTMQGKYNQNNARADANANQHPHQSVQADVEEHEWDMRDRMRQREDAKQSVEPLLVLSLPRKSIFSGDDTNIVNASSYDEESSTTIAGKLATPPIIVAMCATPPGYGSLIEKRDSVYSSSIFGKADGQFKAMPPCSKPLGPSLDELVGHVAVLTTDGDVHVVEFCNPPSRSNDSQGSDEGCIHANEMNAKLIPVVNFVFSFSTPCLEATCISMYPVLDHKKDGSCKHPTLTESSQSFPSIRLCIGHKSGLLAAYQIYSLCAQVQTSPKGAFVQKGGHHRSPTANNTATYITEIEAADFRDGRSNFADSSVLLQNDVIPLQRTRSEPIAVSDVSQSGMTSIVGPPRVELCWMGKFDVSVRSLSSPGWGWLSNEEAQIALLVVGMERRENASLQVCMHGIGPPVPHHSLSPALSLEVINVTLAQNLWATGVNADGMRHLTGVRPRPVPLHDCIVWPAAGKEIKDGWLRGGSRRGVDPRDKLFGALGLQRTSVTSKICCFEGPDPCFASAASDGTVAVSHFQSGDGQWGVMDEDDQIMLFQRCIGMGALDFDHYLPSNDSLKETLIGTGRYVACCLRAGTILLVPVAKNDTIEQTRRTRKNNDLIMFTVPVASNGDDDGVVHFVQSFTAGISHIMMNRNFGLGKENFNLMRNMAEFCMKPIAIVGYTGGVLDVYEISPGRVRTTLITQ